MFAGPIEYREQYLFQMKDNLFYLLTALSSFFENGEHLNENCRTKE